MNEDAERWSKKAPDSIGWWVRLNVIHKPEIVHVFEDYRNPDKALCVMWGWGGGKDIMRIRDNLHKIEHFYWIKLPELPSRDKG